MKKLNVLISAALVAAAVSAAAAETAVLDFDGKAPGCRDLKQAIAACEAPVPGAALAEPVKAPEQARGVRFGIRDGFYGTNSMAAFDLGSGYKAVAMKYGADWQTRVEAGGFTDTGRVSGYQLKRYTYVSGASAVTLEIKDGFYFVTGTLAADLAGGAPASLDLAGKGSGDAAFSLKSGQDELSFSRIAVTGRTANPRLAGALTVLYLAMLRDTPSAMYRSVNFTRSTEIDDNGGGWTSCSDTSQSWIVNDVEYRITSHNKQDNYVCKFNLTWNCHWRGCSEQNPHTNPGQCYCKAACYKSATNTGDCHWEAAE